MGYPHTVQTGQTRTVMIDAIYVNRKRLRKLSQTKISQYAIAYERGDNFPPICVEDCGGFYTIRDGRHRYQAQRIVGFSVIDVVIY